MRHLLLQPASNFIPLYFDLEEIVSPGDFVWCIMRGLLSQDRLRGLLQTAKNIPISVQTWFQGSFDEIGFEGARAHFLRATKEEPDRPFAWFLLAHSSFALGRYEDALPESIRAVELDATSINRFYHAFVIFYSGQRVRAIAVQQRDDRRCRAVRRNRPRGRDLYEPWVHERRHAQLYGGVWV